MYCNNRWYFKYADYTELHGVPALHVVHWKKLLGTSSKAIKTIRQCRVYADVR